MVCRRNFRKCYRVYVANLEKRTDRKKHIASEFKNREEFEMDIVPSKEMEIGAEGLWETFKAILMKEVALESDFFVFCEDDHSFTNAYTLSFFEERMEDARKLQADVLMGGVSWCESGIQIRDNLFWVDKFSGTQFIVIFSKFYERLIAHKSFRENDALDRIVCRLSDEKLVMFPMISVQKEFGYSDATDNNNKAGRVDFLFEKTAKVFQTLDKVKNHYHKNQIEMETTYEGFSIPVFVFADGR